MFQENGASLFEAANIKSLVASWNVKSNQRRLAKSKFEMCVVKRNFESFAIKDILHWTSYAEQDSILKGNEQNDEASDAWQMVS